MWTFPLNLFHRRQPSSSILLSRFARFAGYFRRHAIVYRTYLLMGRESCNLNSVGRPWTHHCHKLLSGSGPEQLENDTLVEELRQVLKCFEMSQLASSSPGGLGSTLSGILKLYRIIDGYSKTVYLSSEWGKKLFLSNVPSVHLFTRFVGYIIWGSHQTWGDFSKLEPCKWFSYR